MSARPQDLGPDLEVLRKEFEQDKKRVRKSGDEQGAQWLDELEQKAADPSFWKNAPSVKEQLADHLKRLGVQ